MANMHIKFHENQSTTIGVILFREK